MDVMLLSRDGCHVIQHLTENNITNYTDFLPFSVSVYKKHWFIPSG